MEKMEKVMEKVMENHGIFYNSKSMNPVFKIMAGHQNAHPKSPHVWVKTYLVW